MSVLLVISVVALSMAMGAPLLSSSPALPCPYHHHKLELCSKKQQNFTKTFYSLGIKPSSFEEWDALRNTSLPLMKMLKFERGINLALWKLYVDWQLKMNRMRQPRQAACHSKCSQCYAVEKQCLLCHKHCRGVIIPVFIDCTNIRSTWQSNICVKNFHRLVNTETTKPKLGPLPAYEVILMRANDTITDSATVAENYVRNDLVMATSVSTSGIYDLARTAMRGDKNNIDNLDLNNNRLLKAAINARCIEK